MLSSKNHHWHIFYRRASKVENKINIENNKHPYYHVAYGESGWFVGLWCIILLVNWRGHCRIAIILENTKLWSLAWEIRQCEIKFRKFWFMVLWFKSFHTIATIIHIVAKLVLIRLDYAWASWQKLEYLKKVTFSCQLRNSMWPYLVFLWRNTTS